MRYTILAMAVVVICWSPLAFLLGWLAHKRRLARLNPRPTMSPAELQARLEHPPINLKPPQDGRLMEVTKP